MESRGLFPGILFAVFVNKAFDFCGGLRSVGFALRLERFQDLGLQVQWETDIGAAVIRGLTGILTFFFHGLILLCDGFANDKEQQGDSVNGNSKLVYRMPIVNGSND